jgi:hypothetical protein
MSCIDIRGNRAARLCIDGVKRCTSSIPILSKCMMTSAPLGAVPEKKGLSPTKALGVVRERDGSREGFRRKYGRGL